MDSACMDVSGSGSISQLSETIDQMSGVYSAQLLAYIFFYNCLFLIIRLGNSKWVLMPQGVLQCLTFAQAKQSYLHPY